MEIQEITKLGWRYDALKEGYKYFDGFIKKGSRHELGLILLHNSKTNWTLISEKDPSGLHLTRFSGKITSTEELSTLHKFLEI